MPGGTFVKVSVWPVTSVTVTVHPSADATGILAIRDNKIAPARATSSDSFRLPSNVAGFLPFAVCRQHLGSADVATFQQATDWFGGLQRGTVVVTGHSRL